MTEQNARIQVLVEKIGSLLGPYKCVGFRTDYMVTGQGINRRCLVPERHGASSRYAILSSRENMRPKGVRALVNFLGMKEEDANTVLELALELSELNDLGSWPIAIDDREPRVADQFGIGDRRYGRLPGFASAYENLRDALPQIDRIQIMTHTGVRNTGKSQKGWMHFSDGAGDQVCAISTNLLATSVRHWFGDDADERTVADRHLGRWAHQVNTELDRFIEAAMILLQFDSLLGTTKIILKEA